MHLLNPNPATRFFCKNTFDRPPLAVTLLYLYFIQYTYITMNDENNFIADLQQQLINTVHWVQGSTIWHEQRHWLHHTLTIKCKCYGNTYSQCQCIMQRQRCLHGNRHRSQWLIHPFGCSFVIIMICCCWWIWCIWQFPWIGHRFDSFLVLHIEYRQAWCHPTQNFNYIDASFSSPRASASVYITRII